MTDPQQVAKELVETWRNGNRKDAVEGILRMQSKKLVAQVSIHFVEELTGCAKPGTNARYELNTLKRLLASRGHPGG
jgi:hypothetical protein